MRPVCRHYLLDNSSLEYEGVVNGKHGEKYHTFYSLKLKRNIDIFFDKVTKVTHLFPINEEEYEEIIADEFLNELLSRRSEEEFRNIVFSIQKKQGEIIQIPFKQNLIVQGCAGSGKSMIMLHRLPILLYDNPSDLQKNNIYIITPSAAYIQMVQRMLIELEISDIQMGTLDQYYLHVLNKYKQDTKEFTKSKRLVKVDADKEEYIYSSKCVKDISIVIRSYMAAGAVDHVQAYDLLDIKYKKSKSTLPANIIRAEVVRIQEVLNANGKNLRNYFDQMVNLVYALIDLSRKLASCREDILKNIDRAISEKKNIVNTAKNEMLTIDRSQHERMYNNRVKTINSASEMLSLYRNSRESVENNDAYFERLKEIAKSINGLTALFKVTKKDTDLPSVDMMYRAVVLRDVFINDSIQYVQDIHEEADPYYEYVDGLNSMINVLIPLIDTFREVSDPVLEYGYYNKLEKRRKYLQILGNHISEDVYDSILRGAGIEKDVRTKKNEKGEVQEIREYPTFTFTLYLKLQILRMLQGTPQSGAETLIAIDEAQSVAPEEIKLISAVNNNRTVFNLYGDVKQHVEGTKGLDSWNEIMDVADFEIRKMNENYRNALQITQYCNKRFKLNMKAINLDGDGVHEIRNTEQFLEKLFQLFRNPLKPGISSIIIKNLGEAEYLKEILGSLSERINDIATTPSALINNKWNVLTIDQAKGLEFETVIVLSGRMTENEKYIAYTRALNELYIFDEEVVIPESAKKDGNTKKTQQSDKKKVRPIREKWKSDKKKAILEFTIIPYEKNNNDLENEVYKNMYVYAGQKGLTTSFIPVYVDKAAHNIYISYDKYNDNIGVFEKGTIVLRDLSGTNTEEVSIGKIIKPINIGSNNTSEQEVKNIPYTIVLYEKLTKAITDSFKLMNNRYVLVEKKGLTSTYEGVFVDDTSHKIYLLLDTYKAHKDVFMKNTIILRDSSKNQNMEVRIAGITELRS